MNIKNKIQLLRTMFLSKYVSLAVYNEDVKIRFSIDHEEIQFNKNDVWGLIGILDEPNGLMSDHEYFFIREYIVDRTKSNYQGNNISLNIILNEPNKNYSNCDETEIYDDKICKKKRVFGNNTPWHNLQINREKNSVDYSNR